jgi:Domain of unknown function (DUF4397)
MKHTRLMGAVSALAIAGGLLMSAGSAGSGAAPQGSVAIIQAVPGLSLEVTVDDKATGSAQKGDILGPMPLSAGRHTVTFADSSGTLAEATVDVQAGRTSDVVIHRPAEVGGDPVVSVYPTPDEPIGPGKARVLLAHTATVAPADVDFDGTVVFTNIANGEFAQADVPAGEHVVALLPSGVTGADPILGPLEVTLEEGTVTAVYAVGNPEDGSMDVIVRLTDLAADGTQAPETIDTGSAGMVADVEVHPFSVGD